MAACASEHGALSSYEVGGGRVAVYLPPCALERVDRRYRTVYLLHGGSADETQWPAIGLVSTADELIVAKEIAPLIVVMPDTGLGATAPSIVDDVVPWADAHLPTSATRADRAIGGISAGGASAIRLVAAHPDLFSRLGGHSPVVDAIPADLDRLAAWDGAVWLDVGDSDDLRSSTMALMARLETGAGRPEIHVSPGQHDRAYWRAHVADYLRFYAGRP